MTFSEFFFKQQILAKIEFSRFFDTMRLIENTFETNFEAKQFDKRFPSQVSVF